MIEDYETMGRKLRAKVYDIAKELGDSKVESAADPSRESDNCLEETVSAIVEGGNAEKFVHRALDDYPEGNAIAINILKYSQFPEAMKAIMEDTAKDVTWLVPEEVLRVSQLVSSDYVFEQVLKYNNMKAMYHVMKGMMMAVGLKDEQEFKRVVEILGDKVVLSAAQAYEKSCPERCHGRYIPCGLLCERTQHSKAGCRAGCQFCG